MRTVEKRLSHKEIGFVKDFVKTNNGTQAVLNNYNTTNPDVASAMANEILKRPKITSLIDEYIKEEDLYQVHKEGLASVRQVNKIVGRDSKGQPEYEFVDVVDYQTRHKYLETGYKILGKLAPEKDPGGNTFNFNFNIGNTLQKVYGGNDK